MGSVEFAVTEGAVVRALLASSFRYSWEKGEKSESPVEKMRFRDLQVA